LSGIENLTTLSNTIEDSERKEKVIEGVRFLLSHFQAARQQLFPRKMSTSVSDGKQFTVCTKSKYCKNVKRPEWDTIRNNLHIILSQGNLIFSMEIVNGSIRSFII
jgi:hypothetical protein